MEAKTMVDRVEEKEVQANEVLNKWDGVLNLASGIIVFLLPVLFLVGLVLFVRFGVMESVGYAYSIGMLGHTGGILMLVSLGFMAVASVGAGWYLIKLGKKQLKSNLENS